MNTYSCSISDITLRNEMIPFQRDHDLTTLEKKNGTVCHWMSVQRDASQSWVSLSSQLAAATDSRHQFNASINYYSLHQCVWSGKRRSCFMEAWWLGEGQNEKMKELWGGKKERNRSFRQRLNEKLILKEETKENRFKVY